MCGNVDLMKFVRSLWGLPSRSESKQFSRTSNITSQGRLCYCMTSNPRNGPSISTRYSHVFVAASCQGRGILPQGAGPTDCPAAEAPRRYRRREREVHGQSAGNARSCLVGHIAGRLTGCLFSVRQSTKPRPFCQSLRRRSRPRSRSLIWNW